MACWFSSPGVISFVSVSFRISGSPMLQRLWDTFVPGHWHYVFSLEIRILNNVKFFLQPKQSDHPQTVTDKSTKLPARRQTRGKTQLLSVCTTNSCFQVKFQNLDAVSLSIKHGNHCTRQELALQFIENYLVLICELKFSATQSLMRDL